MVIYLSGIFQTMNLSLFQFSFIVDFIVYFKSNILISIIKITIQILGSLNIIQRIKKFIVEKTMRKISRFLIIQISLPSTTSFGIFF